MHFAFIPYGARAEVERLMRDIESQKFQLKLWKKDEKDKAVWITGQVRELPFGVKEIVFPREYRDVVISTMTNNTAPNRLAYERSKVYRMVKAGFRKIMGLKPMPKNFSTEAKLLWDLEYVSIIPLGIREDSDLTEGKDLGYKGWDHESL